MTSPNSRADLPASAQARLDHLRAGDALCTSYLSSASAAALRSVGLTAVGDVMGCATSQVGYAYVSPCSRGLAPGTGVQIGGRTPGGGTGYLGLVRTLYATALRRLTDEARAVGADGVVGISLTVTERGQVMEVVALGTGVRAGPSPRLERPFTTDLAGTDVAKLLVHGWVPVSLHVAAQLGVRHVDNDSARFLRSGEYAWSDTAGRVRANTEVAAPTELMEQTRAAARAVLADQVAGAGADGCLLSGLDYTPRVKECQSIIGGSADVVALCVATGTSLARSGGGARTAPNLIMMPVQPRGRRRR